MRLFEIPFRELREASHGCRSRRNLAGRLANLLFTDEEKSTSNYRGVLNKKRLDIRKTEAIRKASISDFPPKQYETSQMVERDIREGVDEMCNSLRGYSTTKTTPTCDVTSRKHHVN